MKKIKNWFINNRDYFYPALLTFLIMFFAFLIMGVHPFGRGYTGIIDYVAGLVPSYTHLWDFIHGESNFLFNENLGMGANMYASSVLNTFFSPISYLVGLFPREDVHFAIGYVVVVKMMLMATTSYIIFRKWFKTVDTKTTCVFSLLWTFSSWLLVHISNIGWLDVMIIFPFLIESLKTLIEKGKISSFVIMLTLCLIFSYYMSYMILIMMVVGITCANYTIVKKEERKRVVGQVFIGTLFALLLSMFAFLPSFLQTQASYRFSDETASTQGFAFYTKLIMILFYGVILLLPFKLFKNHRDDNKVKFLIGMIGLTLLPIILEPINKMWHTGSYFSYPFRFSYIPIFFLIIASLYYLNNYYENEYKEAKKLSPFETIMLYVTGMMLPILLFVLIIGRVYYSAHLGFLVNFSSFILYALTMCIGVVFTILMHKCLDIKYKKTFLGVISLVQIFAYTCGFMTYKGSSNIEQIYEVKNSFDLDKLDDNYAYKDETRELINNTPLILDHKSISTWLHINGMYANLNARALGYGVDSTQISSYGGTAFSDMLSNTKYVLSYMELDESAYNLLEVHEIEYGGKVQKVYLYEYKYNLPVGLMTKNYEEMVDFDYKEDPFYNQNVIYQTLFGKTENIINVAQTDKNVDEEEYIIHLEGNEIVYLYLFNQKFDDMEIYVNDKLLNVQGNGILNLGTFNAENVKVVIKSDVLIDELEFATLDVSLLKEISENYNYPVDMKVEGNKINVKVTSTKDGYIYLPLNYENNSWSATNNGKEVKVERYMECYLLVEVSEGENNIELTFTPMNYDLGIKLTLITLVLVAILFVINIKFKFFNKKGVILVTGTLGSIIGICLWAFVYVIPLMK